MLQTVEDHKKLIFINSFLGFQNFIGPILVVFYTSYMNLSLEQFYMIDSILFFMISVFEVPSGYLADRFGKKRLLLLSQAFTILGLLILIIVPNFTGALLSVMIIGFFGPLGSGNAGAIYYESYQKQNKEKELEKIYAKSGSISFLSLSVCSILSSYLASYNILYPLIVDIILLVISTIAIVLFLHDESSLKKSCVMIEKEKNTFLENLKESRKGLLNVTPIFMISALFFMLIRVSYSFYQPIFTSVNIEIKYFGIVFAVFNIVSSIASSHYTKLTNKVKNKKYLVSLFIGMFILSYIGIYLNRTYLVIVFISLQQVVRGMFFPFFSVYINQYVPPKSKYRVTYLSYKNLLSTLMVSLFLMIFSLLNRYNDLHSSILYFGVISITLLIIHVLLFYILRKRGKIICYHQQH